MVQSNRKIPLARRPLPSPEAPAGIRPSVRRLIERVDQSDPAFLFIVAELQRRRRLELGLDEAGVSQAIEEGRSRYVRYMKDQENRRPGRIPPSIVYYIRRGSLIKIGTTRRPLQRFKDLLPDEILAWEPGSQPEEARRHEQFRDLRVSTGAEYFRRDAALDIHMSQIRDAHGMPDPSWPTLSGLTQRPSRARLPDLPVTPQLVSLQDGTRQLGIRLGTARVWVHRGKLCHVLEDSHGVKLYFLSDLRSLSKARRAATGHDET